MSQSTKETTTTAEELEMTFVVGDKEFDDEKDAREYISEQQVQHGVDAAAAILRDVFGPDAVEHAEDHFGVPFEMIVRGTVDSPNSLATDYVPDPARIIGGQTIATMGKKVTQETEFEG